ncbi:transmembrane protein 233-like [Anneissia japonica]|uniref:transmembrane protein 233-like n=1 Tax=Anneissia japonica TaxID=1529436 RepID=UPI0014255668|nr:transmembrane protein 233-like [Anneissia japonica]
MENDNVQLVASNKDHASYNMHTVVTTDVTVVRTNHYSFLGIGIFVTFCCCCMLPFGLIGIIYSVDSSSRFDRGDFTGALSSASKAKIWSIAGLLIGMVIIGLNILVIVLNINA